VLEDLLLHERHPALAADEDDLVDVPRAQVPLGERLVADLEGPLDEVVGELVQPLARELEPDVEGAALLLLDVGEVDRDVRDEGQVDLRRLGLIRVVAEDPAASETFNVDPLGITTVPPSVVVPVEAFREFTLARVDEPKYPVPDVSPTGARTSDAYLFWNLATAAFVAGPKYDDSLPGAPAPDTETCVAASRLRNFCSSITSAPVSPTVRLRVKT
jgi:hypothetical protein